MILASTTWQVKKWGTLPFKNFSLISSKTWIYPPSPLLLKC